MAPGAVAVALTIMPVMSARALEPPKGWLQAGMNPDDYEMAVDPKGGRSGGPCAYIKAKTADARTFGTLMQTFDAGEYKGKRMRLSGWVRSAAIAKWAGLWMRIDGPTDGNAPAMLGFDNMQGRPIKGTTDWKRYDIVLDVPQKATTVNFGILLEGAGQAWLDGVSFEVVGSDVPVTDVRQDVPKKPVNLDFDQP
jgi:hypothetical protein